MQRFFKSCCARFQFGQGWDPVAGQWHRPGVEAGRRQTSWIGFSGHLAHRTAWHLLLWGDAGISTLRQAALWSACQPGLRQLCVAFRAEACCLYRDYRPGSQKSVAKSQTADRIRIEQCRSAAGCVAGCWRGSPVCREQIANHLWNGQDPARPDFSKDRYRAPG